MIPSTAGAPLDDVEFLARSEHRVAALEALAARPRSRAELRELTGASSSTIGRTLRQFEDRRWVRRNGHEYEATRQGSFVAEGFASLLERLETERALRDVWQWLPDRESGFTVEMLADAVVTVAEVDDPYRPLNRFRSLLRETGRFRFVGFDLALFELCKDDLRRLIVDGMRTEVVDPPRVAEHILETYPDYCAATFGSGNLEVRLHDDLPSYGVGLFDERVGIIGHDPDSGTVRVLIDTDAPAVREWATSAYEAHRRESRPLPRESIAE